MIMTLNYGYTRVSEIFAQPFNVLKSNPTVQRIAQGASAVYHGIRDSVNYVNERKIQTAAIACIMLIASYYYLAPDAGNVSAPECSVDYGSATSLSSYIMPKSLKEYFVISHLSGSALTQKIVEFINLGLGIECLKNQWMDINFRREQPRQEEFDNLIKRTLQGGLPGYHIDHNQKSSTNYSSILYNSSGNEIAVLKKNNWREFFAREFNQDGHLAFPRITKINVPDVKEELMAIEFMHGAAMKYSRAMQDDFGTQQFYESLSSTALALVISQRQRIFITDVLIQNQDRHGYAIMVGCRNNHPFLIPIDHDCAMTKFMKHIDQSLNPFMRSTFSFSNREYIQSLSLQAIDTIAEKYIKNINNEAYWYITHRLAKPIIKRLDALKIISVILKVAVEKQINMAQLSILFNSKINSFFHEIDDAQKKFLLGTKHQNKHSEAFIRDWIEERRIFEDLPTPQKYGYKRRPTNNY